MAKQPYVSKQPAATQTAEQTTATEQTAIAETTAQETTELETQQETTESTETGETSSETTQETTAPTGQAEQPSETSTTEQPEAPVAPAPVQTEQPTTAPVATVAPQTLSSAIDRLVAEPVEVAVLKQTLAEYAGEMAVNRRIAPEVGAGNQLMLSNALVATVTQPDAQVFIALMGVWLDFIRQNRTGVFHEQMVNRFMEHVALTKAKLLQFQYLLHLFTTIADGHSVKERIDVGTALRGFDDTYASRLATYAQRVTAQ